MIFAPHTVRAALLLMAGAALPLAPLSAQEAPREMSSSPTAQAEEQSPLRMRAEQVVALINGELDAPLTDVFTPRFLAAVPEAQIAAISEQLSGQYGAALSVEEPGSSEALRSALAIRMEQAIARGGIAIDPANGNRISELLFQTFEPLDDSAEKIRADLAALPGTTNALFVRLGDDGAVEPVFAHNADTQLALGSAFKLYVLSTLSQSIERGERSWDDVVRLSQRSFPSGQMQDWPEGAPVTLQTLATMMISISDNTATDQLVAELGHETLEAELIASGNADPSRSIPFLTTRQLFAMRGVPDDFITRYRAADDDGQRAMLDGLTEADVSQEQIQQTFASDTPGAIDIEWFAAPADLARLMNRFVAEEAETARAIMAVNPGLPAPVAENWDYVGFKGGSEPGVINLTWLLRDEAGAYWIATFGWNDPQAGVATPTLQTIAQRVLALPRD